MRQSENCAGKQRPRSEKKGMMRVTENDSVVKELKKRCEQLAAEVQTYHNAAALYGIDPMTMLTLAKSQIKTCADNIRLMEKMESVLDMFKWVPKDLTANEVCRAITHYDGDGSKPYCDLVYCGLDVIRKHLEVRSELNEWRKSNLPLSE